MTDAPLDILICIEGAAEPIVVELITTTGTLRVTRRCAELAEVLGAAAAGRGRVALLSAFVPGLDRVTLAELSRTGVRVVGVVDAAGVGQADQARARFDALGIATVLELGPQTGAAHVERVVTTCAADTPDTPHEDEDPLWAELEAAAAAPERAGRLIAVWGPTGAPGRSTVALQLAGRLARTRRRVLLVDADTYGASIGQTLGILEEAPGTAAACRAAHSGTLTAALLTTLAPTVMPGLHVLTGLPRPDRWPELTEVGLEHLWEVAREFADVTIVDAGFCLEPGDGFGPARNGATLSALAAADAVVAVGGSDPVGLSRLIRGSSTVAEVAGGRVVTVVNRVQGQPAELAHLLVGLGESLITLADDPTGVVRVQRDGAAALRTAPTGPLAAGISRLAAELSRVGGIGPSDAQTPIPPTPRRRPRVPSFAGLLRGSTPK